MIKFVYSTYSDATLNSSEYYDLHIATAPTDDCGSPVGEAIDIPGRTGGLSFFTGAYTNTQRTYTVSFPCSSQSEMRAKIRNIRQWLFMNKGYNRLEDDFDTDIYRLARCTAGADFYTMYNQVAEANISFDCDPRKFLKTGEAYVTCTNGGALANSYMESKPIVRITASGSGSVTVNGTIIRILSNPGGDVYVDSEKMSIYNGNTNKSAYVGILDRFPVLKNGNNAISWTGSISSVKIKPNWWQP